MQVTGINTAVNFQRKPTKKEEVELKTTINKAYELIGAKERVVITHGSCFPSGYKNTGINKEMGKNLQPQYNIFSPICNKDSKIYTLDELLSTYKSKFKYYIGNFHEKRGISFEIANDINKENVNVFLVKL